MLSVQSGGTTSPAEIVASATRRNLNGQIRVNAGMMCVAEQIRDASTDDERKSLVSHQKKLLVIQRQLQCLWLEGSRLNLSPAKCRLPLKKPLTMRSPLTMRGQLTMHGHLTRPSQETHGRGGRYVGNMRTAIAHYKKVEKCNRMATKALKALGSVPTA